MVKGVNVFLKDENVKLLFNPSDKSYFHHRFVDSFRLHCRTDTTLCFVIDAEYNVVKFDNGDEFELEVDKVNEEVYLIYNDENKGRVIDF